MISGTLDHHINEQTNSHLQQSIILLFIISRQWLRTLWSAVPACHGYPTFALFQIDLDRRIFWMNKGMFCFIPNNRVDLSLEKNFIDVMLLYVPLLLALLGPKSLRSWIMSKHWTGQTIDGWQQPLLLIKNRYSIGSETIHATRSFDRFLRNSI